MKTKYELAVFAALLSALLFSLAAPMRADDITIQLTTSITGPVGDTITVFGNLTNNTSNTLDFGDDAINLAAPASVASAVDDLITNGFVGGPTSIAPNATLGNVDLFTISLLGGAGTYAGNAFDLIGGTDPVACSLGTTGCDQDLGGTTFSFDVAAPTPTPEPATLLLLAPGFASLGLLRKRLMLSR